MDALRTISTGFENAQNVQNTRAAQELSAVRGRDGKEPSRPEQSGAVPSVQVDLSEAARAAARSGSSPPPPVPANTPAVPVQTQEAVARSGSAGNTNRAEVHAAAANREAVQRYVENANNKLPAGQSAPSSVRVSA
ncbi:MAG: hypothetical protein FWD51_03115 [Betaproteobacteria bacterium]|nr:hypothetical protein [Betaproteobacteria bacterium]